MTNLLQFCADFTAVRITGIPVIAVPYTQGTFAVYASNGQVELRIDPNLDLSVEHLSTLLYHELGHLYCGHFSESKGIHTFDDFFITQKDGCAPVAVSDTAEIQADAWAAEHCGGIEVVRDAIVALLNEMSDITGIPFDDFIGEMKSSTPRRMTILGL